VQEARIRDFLSQIVESTEDCIYSVSRDGIIMSWNRGAEKIFGYKTEEAVGQPKRMLVPRGLEDEQSELMQRVFSGEAVTGVQTHRVRKDRSIVPVSLTMSPVHDGRGRVVSAAVLARDETERRRYEQQLQQLADHDTLTGLFNRRRFAEELRRELSRASRSGTGGAVLSVDLDGFKAINDSAGHAAGDAVLAEIGRTLIRHVRGSDVVGRMGGDEFGVLLPEAGREQALAGAEHLLHAIQDCSVNVEGTTFSVTASIGVTLFGADTTSAEELLTGADLAMYSAKEQGRDRIVAFTPDEARTARAGAKLRWSRRLRQALDQDELVLHWQPILDLNSGRVTHGELLLRLRDREKLIYPEAFLAAAEQLGLIHAIDCWVVTTAIRLLAEGREPASLPLSVNLSSKSVAGNPQLLEVIKHELQAHGVDPARLILEITETAAIADIGEARGFAAELKRLGCRLALDDFGTGFASFFHLKHLPVDFIKIDREFIHDLLQSVIDQRLVRGMVHTARNLGLQTVAEAVESRRTLELLRRLGVDYVQGYHVGEPRPVELPAARA
jgi:diguanylate cyclase (GGDEF)-like protein/PAS domain S-box-containing protein